MDYSKITNKPLKANSKTTGKDGKTYWNQIGITVWVGEYNGEATVSLVDERTGSQFPCFPPIPREQRSERGDPVEADSNDNVPF